MRVEGEAPGLADLLFPNGLVPQILRLLIDTWETFDKPADDEDEPKITNRFVKALQNERRRRKLCFRVVAHSKDLEDLDEATGRGFAEIDIMVPHAYDERCYFALEAKKLNTGNKAGHRDSRAGEYVGTDGMGCFVEGRYGSHQNQGGMVGYVMDGDCDRARDSISGAMTRRADELRISTPCELTPSRHLPDRAEAFETKHNLPDRGEFVIHHVLLAA